MTDDEEYVGWFVDWIEDWSQFFCPCNWRTFRVFFWELEDDRIMGGLETTFIILGLGLRLRWNYRITDEAAEIKSRIKSIIDDVEPTDISSA